MEFTLVWLCTMERCRDVAAVAHELRVGEINEDSDPRGEVGEILSESCPSNLLSGRASVAWNLR